MNYKQKYKNALERARDLMTNQNPPAFDKHLIEIVFLELKEKESEDERIKREIVAYINELADLKNEKIPTKWLAWLEKQGEPEDKGEISDGYHTFNELYEYRKLYNAAFFNLLPKELVHKSKRHHDGEECFGGGWFIVMANLPTGQISNHYELKDWDLFQIPEKDVADEWDGHTPQEAADRLHRYLLEKQGDNKPTYKVEPKFKVGDWIVQENIGIYKVIEVCESWYEVVDNKDEHYSISFDKEYMCRLWTINDAKEGDVLIKEETGELFIHNGNRGTYLPEFLGAYCGIDNGEFKPNGSPYYWGIPTCPATKKQRDLLFSKMKEEGYEWDAEKKKLKKIKIKSENLESKSLDADRVIEWLYDQACLGWIEDVEVDKFIEKIQKRFRIMTRKKKIKRIHLDIRDNISPKTAIECVYKIINIKQKNFVTKLKTDDGIISVAKRFYLQIDSFKIEYWKGGEQ